MKKYIIWRITLIFALILIGCNKTPSEDVVVNKNEGILESKIEESSEDLNSINATRCFVDTFKTDVDNIEILIDAEVIAVSQAYPVVRVMPHELTVDEVKHWSEILFEGNAAYEPDTVMTKKEIEDYILNYKEILNNQDALIENYGSENDAEEMMDYYQELIHNLEQLYQTAPEVRNQKECDWLFHPEAYYDSGMFSDDKNELDQTYALYAVTSIDGHEANIIARNRNASDYLVHSLNFYYTDTTDREKANITEKEATEISDQLIQQLMIDSQWSLSNTDIYEDEQAQVITLYYTQEFNGVPTIEVPGLYNIKSEDEYAAKYCYESIEIRFYNGVLDYIFLTSPAEVYEIVNDNVKLLEFSDVLDKAQTYMQLKLSQKDFINGPEDFDIHATVNKIRLGLFRIKEKNSNSFLMVPAWAFYSSVGYGEEGFDETNKLLLVVNAVDGSIINIQLGY